MFANQKLCEGVALAAALAPVVVVNSEVFSGVVDLGVNQQVMGIAMLGNMAAETIDFKFYSCDSDGSNAAAVSGKAATQLAASASANDSKMIVINVRDTDLLASGKQYGKFGIVTGGATIIAGTLASSVIFGTINQIVSFGSTPVIGEIAMLALAIILLRLMPQGITGRFFRNST